MTETSKGLERPELSDLFEAKVRVSSPSTASELSEDKNRKNRSDSGCSYETNEEEKKKPNGSGNSTDSGHGSTELEEGMIYSYHFKIPSHLCGLLIGIKGTYVKQIRSVTKCEVTLVKSNYEVRKGSKKSADIEPQICILEGTRASIERCLELIQEKFPADQYPEFNLEQINRPAPEMIQHDDNGVSVVLPQGRMTNVVITAIESPGHFFVHVPENPSLIHLQRLEDCMYNVYEHLDAPKVPKEIIDVGLICVAKFEDKYYRLQISAYDIDNDCCEFKYLDYGGYDSVEASELLQVRQDFLNLPFQAVECYLSNVIPPSDCSEWPMESLQCFVELVSDQNISCREIGSTEDSTPLVQLYISAMSEDKGELETRFVNKELVEQGCAQWVEHGVVA